MFDKRECVPAVVGSFRTVQSGKAGAAAFPFDTLSELHGCGDIMEGRHDRLKRLDPRRSIDYVRQGLQHLWVGVGVVLVRIVLVLPQS